MKHCFFALAALLIVIIPSASACSATAPIPTNTPRPTPSFTAVPIMTHVRFKPTSNYQLAGLWIQDEKSTVAFGRAYCDTPNVCVGNGVYFDATQDGQYRGNNFAADTTIDDDAYLRIDKNRTKFTAYYSENGTDWMLIGEHEVTMINPQVGIVAGQSYVVGMTAYFDYFTVMELP